MVHTRFETAAEQVLRDDSMHAANTLEGVVLIDYPDDERLDELLEALALYNPSEGPPYVDHQRLRSAVSEALTLLGTCDT